MVIDLSGIHQVRLVVVGVTTKGINSYSITIGGIIVVRLTGLFGTIVEEKE